MQQAKPVVLELYATIANIDSSYLKINWSLRQLKTQVEFMPLDKFERQFRECFHLPPCNRQEQSAPYSFEGANGEVKTVSITRELHDLLLLAESPQQKICSGGNIFFFKKAKTAAADGSEALMGLAAIAGEMAQFRQLIGRIENDLHLIRYGTFGVVNFFACIDGRPVLFDEKSPSGLVSPKGSDGPYLVKDNYLLKLLLSADHKIASYVQLAMQNYYESYNIANPAVRFISLMLCLEICFSMPNLISNDHIVSRHAAMLVTSGKEAFYQVYAEVMHFCRMKTTWMDGAKGAAGTVADMELTGEAMERLEGLVRLILKKMIKLNIKDKEVLFNLLNQGNGALRHLAGKNDLYA